jgi:beta-glucosidase
MKMLRLSVAIISFGVLSSCATKTTEEIYLYQCQWGSAKFDLCRFENDSQRVDAILAEMNLDEKLGQMPQSVWHNSVSPQIIGAFGIGSIIHTDGPVPGPLPTDWMDMFDQFQQNAMDTRLGIPLMVAVDAVHGQNTYEGAVVFPHNIGLAASGNMSLIQRAAEITAIESVGTGFNWTFSPCIAMPEHEHWGRVYEGFSEDLSLTLAATQASVTGLQGEALHLDHTIAATAKHYLGDGATDGGIEGGDATLTNDEIRQRHLPTYVEAVKHDVAAIMVGFNSVNGIAMHQHKELVQDILKDEVGFDGVVLTDWNGGLRFGEPHTVINAGVDIAMQPGNHEEFLTKLKATVLDGSVPMQRIDDAVRESAVLLKNTRQALPLRPDESIVVVGEHADNTGLQSGGWSIRWQGLKRNYLGATSILAGMRQQQPQVQYFAEGCPADMQADKVVAVVGEYPYAEGVGDTQDIWISEQQQQMLAECAKSGVPLITVLISGRLLLINSQLALSDSFVAAWLPGSEGSGIADVWLS